MTIEFHERPVHVTHSRWGEGWWVKLLETADNGKALLYPGSKDAKNKGGNFHTSFAFRRKTRPELQVYSSRSRNVNGECYVWLERK